MLDEYLDRLSAWMFWNDLSSKKIFSPILTVSRCVCHVMYSHQTDKKQAQNTHMKACPEIVNIDWHIFLNWIRPTLHLLSCCYIIEVESKDYRPEHEQKNIFHPRIMLNGVVTIDDSRITAVSLSPARKSYQKGGKILKTAYRYIPIL